MARYVSTMSSIYSIHVDKVVLMMLSFLCNGVDFFFIFFLLVHVLRNTYRGVGAGSFVPVCFKMEG